MQITPEWLGVVLTLMTMSGGFGAYIQRRFDVARHALPIIRSDWNAGTKGFTVKIELVNRLNEDLNITLIEAKNDFSESHSDYDTNTSKATFTYTLTPSPMPLDWVIKAYETDKRSFCVEDASSEHWLRLTMSSSARTFRSKRLIIRPRTQE